MEFHGCLLAFRVRNFDGHLVEASEDLRPMARQILQKVVSCSSGFDRHPDPLTLAPSRGCLGRYGGAV